MKRLLICDDEPHVVEGLRFLLRAPDRHIETAVNGREGLERIRRQRPDLLITDVMMPGAGREAPCRRVYARPADHHLHGPRPGPRRRNRSGGVVRRCHRQAV